MQRILHSEDWQSWFERCAFPLCSPEVRQRFNHFCWGRLEKAIQGAVAERNKLLTKNQAPRISIQPALQTIYDKDDTQVQYPALQEVDVWALAAAPERMAEKTKKDWLSESTRQARTREQELEQYEGRLTKALKTDIADRYLKEHFYHEMSLNQPIEPIGDPDGPTRGDMVEDATVEGNKLNDQTDLQQLAVSALDVLLGPLDPIDRLIFACMLREIELNSPALRSAVGLGHSAVYGRANRLKPLLRQTAATALPDADERTRRYFMAQLVKEWGLRDETTFPPEKMPWESFNRA